MERPAGTTTMEEGSEEEKTSLIGDRRNSESGGGGREEGATADVKSEHEIETKNSPESEGVEGFVDVDGKGGKIRNPLKKLRRKQKKEKIQEVPEVVISNPTERGAPTIEELQRELKEAENIMRAKVEQLLNDRDQRLENVLDRSERLVDTANDFARVSRRARIRMYLRSNKWKIYICTAVVLIVIAGVIVTVAILMSKGIIKIQA